LNDHSKILDAKEAIYKCAKDFRHDANFMMTELASEFKFEIQPSISFPKEVYRHYNNKGVFKGEWSFYFHGSHCRFEHLNTGQVLEVMFTHSPEFGYINPYFFLVYLMTTEKHKWLVEVLNEENIHFAIELLMKEGVLTKIEDTTNNNLVLAI
jgi:hypothetical protein